MEKPIVRFVRVSTHYKKVNGKRKRIRGYIRKEEYQKVRNAETGSTHLMRIPAPKKHRITFYANIARKKRKKKITFWISEGRKKVKPA
jgi:hypothetical protein